MIKKILRFFNIRFRLVIWRSQRNIRKTCEDKIAYLSRSYGDKELSTELRKIYIENIFNLRKESQINCWCLSSLKWGYIHCVD